jgi:hypothetical protein
VRFGKCHFESAWDASGRKKMPTPAFVSELTLIDEDETEEHGWSCGKDYQASKDGVKAAPAGDFLVGPALRKSSNFTILLSSIIDALPDDKKEEYMEKLCAGNASAFDGMEAHMLRITPERPGLEKRKAADGKEYDQQVLVVDTITRFPWDKKAPPGVKSKAGAGKAAGAKAANTKAPETNEDDLNTEAVMEVVKVLGANDNAMDRTALSEALFKSVKDAKKRNKIIQMAYEGDWLTTNAEAGGWEFDSETDVVTMA